MTPTTAQTSKKLTRDIWMLGFVSLFMDMSSETVHGLMPVFLVAVLGASATSVGILEGIAEGTTLVMKVFSGPLSDWFGRRKPLVVLGYSMAAMSKPLFALATSVPWIYGARLFDRIGKGIRGAPRDALIADIAPEELRGRAFGLRQSLDTVGGFLGPLLAIVLMRLTSNQYRQVFWYATIPACICVVLLLFGVHEKEKPNPVDKKNRIRVEDLKSFTRAFWLVAGAGAFFQLARFSEAFLILRARDVGLGDAYSPLVLIVMNVVYAALAYPIGRLSDTFRREGFLLAALVVLCASDIFLGWGTTPIEILIGVALWGFHLALSQGILTALVADHCAPHLRGTAYGLFNLFSAIALLIASVMAGILWDQLGPQSTFIFGGGFALLSLVVFFFVRPKG